MFKYDGNEEFYFIISQFFVFFIIIIINYIVIMIIYWLHIVLRYFFCKVCVVQDRGTTCSVQPLFFSFRTILSSLFYVKSWIIHFMFWQISGDAVRPSTELLYNVRRIYPLLLACPLLVFIVFYKSCKEELRISVIHLDT